MLGYIGEEDAQAEWHGQQAFNGTTQGPRSLRLDEAFFTEQVDSTITRV